MSTRKARIEGIKASKNSAQNPGILCQLATRVDIICIMGRNKGKQRKGQNSHLDVKRTDDFGCFDLNA